MKLEEIMIREVVQISPENCVGEAAKRMHERAVGCLAVTAAGAIKGILSDRDLLRCVAQGHDPRQCKVSTHMSRPVVVLRPEEDCLTAAEVMRRRGVKRVPIARSGVLLGIVSLSDLARVAANEWERLESSARHVSSLFAALQARARPAAGAENHPVKGANEGKAVAQAIESAQAAVL